MKKILLLNPPGTSRYLRDQYCSSSAKAAYYWPPIDLLVLSGLLKDEFRLEVLDCIAERISPRRARERIRRSAPEAVIALTSTASKEEDFDFFSGLKRDLPAKLVLNGGFLRDDAPRFLGENDFIDAIITDYTRDGIVDYLRGEDFSPGKGLICRDENRAEFFSLQGTEEGFSYPCPRHDLFCLSRYRMPQSVKKPFTCSLISSGCPFDCSFCSSANIPYRRRDVGNLLDELRAIKNMGIPEVHFPDFTFTADRTHSLNVCRMMTDENTGLSWDCLTRTDCVDEELIFLMKQAGCHTIQFGVETKSEKLLRGLNKNISNEATRRAFSLCRKAGIRTIAFFILGLPGDDEAGIRESADFARELDCDYVSFSVYVPDYGSRLRKELCAAGRVPENAFNFDRTKIPRIQAGELACADIWRLRKEAVRGFYLRPEYIKKMIGTLGSFSRMKMAFSLFRSLIG